MEERVQEPKTRKIDTSLLVGLTAIFISVATLGVYIYQAKIMQSQLHTAVWPYIESSTSNYQSFYLEVTNKGIGPAIIKNSTWYVNDKEAKSLEEFFELLLGEKKKKMMVISSYVNGRVMSAGESFKPFQVIDSTNMHLVDSAFRTQNVRFEICLLFYLQRVLAQQRY